MAAVTPSEAANIDRAAREERGIPERLLMENAGRAAALVLDRLFPRGRVVAAVGRGNNGGDALVLLRTLRSWGREVGWVAAGDRDGAAELLHGFDVPRSTDVDAAFSAATILVDGVLGTGARGEPRDEAARLVRTLNGAGRPILSLDLPSGVDAASGRVPGEAVSAEATVCFGWPKRGLFFPPARERCGRILAVEIAFPPLAEPLPGAALITPGWAVARLPRRVYGDHKGSVGALLLLAGSRGMAGAAVIAARSAARAGAGYVLVASPEANRTILQGKVPEAVFLDREDAEGALRSGRRADAIVVGPGLGTDDAARRALDAFLGGLPGIPVLLDADALTLLGCDGVADCARQRPVLVTPHPGELSRLLGEPTAAIIEDPLAAASETAARTGATVLLKGAPSVVAAAGRRLLIDTGGSSDLASAGMGDHLSGVAGTLLAAGLEPGDAAGAALYISGRAAALADRGASLSPLEVAAHLGEALAERPDRSPPGLPFVHFDQHAPG